MLEGGNSLGSAFCRISLVLQSYYRCAWNNYLGTPNVFWNEFFPVLKLFNGPHIGLIPHAMAWCTILLQHYETFAASSDAFAFPAAFLFLAAFLTCIYARRDLSVVDMTTRNASTTTANILTV